MPYRAEGHTIPIGCRVYIGGHERERTCFVENSDVSRQLHQRASKVIPGGVDSPVRAFKSVASIRRTSFAVRAATCGTWMVMNTLTTSAHGVLSFLAMHFLKWLKRWRRPTGTEPAFGACTPVESEVAEEVIRAFPSMDKVRFVSSGTEATMSAIRLARAFTNRKYIVKFEGCYHGHADSLLVKAGSGVATLGIPGPAGVLRKNCAIHAGAAVQQPAAVEEAFTRLKDQIACVIVEPVVGNMGVVPPDSGYLQFLRKITQKNDEYSSWMKL